ncbi:MAG: nucleotide-binding protein, partial [Bacteroidota bacterium]|nr:nucleotide-binding protein [Bacteroidota bacterium]
MPSFDLVSKVDLQTLDNAINTLEKEIKNRYDFKGNHIIISLDKKEFKLDLEAESEMKLHQVI